MTRTIIAVRHKPVWRHKGTKRGIARKRRASWHVTDRGKIGKTPRYKQWSRKIKNKPSHKIEDYQISLPLSKRRRLLRREVRERAHYGAARFDSLGKIKEGALSTKRTLQKIVNLNPSRKSDRIMKKDISFLKKEYKV